MALRGITQREVPPGRETVALRYGQRNSVYYHLVSEKTDLWGNDLHSEPVVNGVNASYDGSWQARNSFQYRYQHGPLELDASYLLAKHPLLQKQSNRYKRHNGFGLGINYQLAPDLQWGTAWNQTRATLYSGDRRQQRHYRQQLFGSALSWTPGLWTLALSGGWYHNFVPLSGQPVQRYFAARALGASYYISRELPVNRYGLKGLLPYYFGAQLRAGDHHQRYLRENGLGTGLLLVKGFRIDYQHVFRSSNDHMGDLNLMRLRYDF